MTSVSSYEGSSENTSARLYATARHHACAFIQHAQEPWTGFGAIDSAIRAGTVVELLAKALLATHDERLIAKGDDVYHHLLDAVFDGRLSARVRPRTARVGRATIDASIAISLASRLDAGVARYEQAAGRVCKARNAAIHLTVPCDAVSLNGIVTDAISFANAAVVAQQQSIKAFWGSDYDDAARWLSRHAEETAVEARRLVQAAREFYMRRRAAVPGEAWRTVLDMLQKGAVPIEADLDAPVDCPACSNEATVTWAAQVDVEDDHGEPVYYSGYVLEELRCPVCSLRLDGEQLDALELDDIWDAQQLAAEAAYDQYFG